MTSEPESVELSLSAGDRGAAVVDVQRRLHALGFPTDPDLPGAFGRGTRSAVEGFQHQRGLRVDGWCGPQTWSALVEAGRRLGDRFLYRRSPMLRGDDVSVLQQRLGALGFDCGRVDGIFGDLTSRALCEFQRNAGLPVDGIAGASTIRELLRFGRRHDDTELVSAVRERVRLRETPRTLRGLHVAIGHEGGLEAAAGALRRTLAAHGTLATVVQHPDGSALAALANGLGADVYLGVRLATTGPDAEAAYYSGFRYESAGGRLLAGLLAEELDSALDVRSAASVGMSLPVLRETRMPAVLCTLGRPELFVRYVSPFADAVARSLARWVESASESPSEGAGTPSHLSTSP